MSFGGVTNILICYSNIEDINAMLNLAKDFCYKKDELIKRYFFKCKYVF